jgi:hypothetical protein
MHQRHHIYCNAREHIADQVSTHLQRCKQLARRHPMVTKLASQTHVHLGVLLQRLWVLVPRQ